jgi:hypothetical protein
VALTRLSETLGSCRELIVEMLESFYLRRLLTPTNPPRLYTERKQDTGHNENAFDKEASQIRSW